MYSTWKEIALLFALVNLLLGVTQLFISPVPVEQMLFTNFFLFSSASICWWLKLI